MTYINVLSFAADNPWTAFALSWPTALVLIAVCWSLTGALTALANTVSALWVQLASLFVVLVRGYAPVERDDDDPDDGGESKPLAS